MSDDYFRMGIVALASSILSAAGTVMGFRPRVIRLEEDMKGKLNKETFKEVKSHIDTKFNTQGREIGEIKSGIKTLLERREKDREGDRG